MAIPFVVDDGRACHVARLPTPDPVVGTQCLGCDRVTRQGPAVWPAAAVKVISFRYAVPLQYRWECLHRVHASNVAPAGDADKHLTRGGVDEDRKSVV